MSSGTPAPVYILGAGMHPWGKWGRDFTEYGVVAARAALRDAGLDWRQIQLVAGADTIRNGYPGFVAGATFAQKLGWTGIPVSSSYAACASGSQALQSARAQIMAGLCDVALVIGADTTPRVSSRRSAGTPQRPGLAAVPPDRGHQHRLLRAAGPPPDGPLRRHRRGLRRGEGEELPARPRQPECPVPQGDLGRGRAGQPGGLRSAAAARHLRDLRRCRSGDRRVEGVHRETPRQHRGRAVGAGHLHGHAELPAASARIAGHRNRFHRRCTGTGAGFQDHILDAAYAEAGIGPEDLSVAEVYDLSTALELDWYEHLGLCPKGEAEQLLRSGATAIGGRIPVNPSGGLASFGEAIPPRRSRRSANSPGNSGARPPAARSRAPLWASPPTRACSVTAPR